MRRAPNTERAAGPTCTTNRPQKPQPEVQEPGRLSAASPTGSHKAWPQFRELDPKPGISGLRTYPLSFWGARPGVGLCAGWAGARSRE